MSMTAAATGGGHSLVRRFDYAAGRAAAL